MQECWYGGSFSFRVICGSLVVRIDAASRPITIHRTTITPLGYIPAHTVSSSFLRPHVFSLPLSRTHACPPAHPSLFLPTFFITTCLITNSQAHLPHFAWEKLPGIWIIARYSSLFLARLELLFVISPAEIQIILGGANCYLLAVCIEYIQTVVSSSILNTASNCAALFLSFSLSRARAISLLFYLFFPIFARLSWNFYTQSSARYSFIYLYVFVLCILLVLRKKNVIGTDLVVCYLSVPRCTSLICVTASQHVARIVNISYCCWL